MRLSAEDQCMLSLMQIAGFPVEIEHGLYTYDLDAIAETTGGFHLYNRASQSSKRATTDIKNVVKIFERWKEERNEN